jgi:outer membrane protein assembly factor BamA
MKPASVRTMDARATRIAGALWRRSGCAAVFLMLLSGTWSGSLSLADAQIARTAVTAGASQSPQSGPEHGSGPTLGTGSQPLPNTSQATLQVMASYEGQQVTAIDIAGRPEATAAQFASLLVQHAGEPFSKQKVEATVNALRATGKFTGVQLQFLPEANGVRILLIAEPAIYFGIFQFPGAERFGYSRLIQAANYNAQAPFSAADIEQDRQGLLTFFRQEGYFESQVDPETRIDTPHGVANIVFHVSLKRKAKFGNIVFTDVDAAQAATLRDDLQKLGARLLSAAIRPGKPYRLTTVTHAQAYLQSHLAKQNRLAAQVKLAEAEYHADTNRADIYFDVHTGPSIQVEIAGAHLFPWTRKSLLPVYQGIPADDESVQEGRDALLSYFQARGYFDVTVDAQFNRQTAGAAIVYRIARQKKHKVTGVKLTGNSQVHSEELTAHLAVEKSHFLSSGKFSENMVRDSVKNLKAVYQSEGFSEVQVTSSIQRPDGNVAISFAVNEGPRDIVNTLRIEGANTFPESRFAPQGLKLGEGKPYSQELVQSDRTTIVSNYLKAGYLISSFHQTATVASKSDPHRINVVYQISEGPQVIAAAVNTLGREHAQQRLIDEDISFIVPGQPLTETELLTGESKLYDHAGVFDWAEVDPRRQITTQTHEDVLVKVHEAQQNQITYGFGFELINRGGSVPGGTATLPGLPPLGLPTNFTTNQQTFYGPRGTFQYTRNDVRGQGESLSFTAFAGRLDQRLAAYYIDPNFAWSKWKATASVSGEVNEENPLYSSRQGLAAVQMQRRVFGGKATTVFFRYGLSQTSLSRIAIPELVPSQDQHIRLSTLAANLTHDTRDNALDEHKGMLDSVEVDFNTTKVGSSVDFAKLTAQAAYFKTIPHNIVLANSLRIGLAQPFSSSFVPLSEEFFTGGGNTLRGFPLDGAGPQRQVEVCPNGTTGCNQFIQVPSGGNELLLLNSELRMPLPIKKGLGMVVFYDGGNVFPSIGLHDFASLYTNNAGLGLRYATPVGPVRVDFGHNLNPIPGIKSTQYFISIGQAF